MRVVWSILAFALAATPAAAQDVVARLAAGDSLRDALEPARALEEYRAAFRLEQSPRVAWRFAVAQVDVAKQLLDESGAARRDSLYGVAKLYAEHAVRLDSTDAEAQFALALALGRFSRTRGGKERVRFGKEIYNAAARAIELDPSHDGAHHVLGAWHAEVMRLSGITKFFAKTFLGAGYMNRASWDSAAAHLERAIELHPEHIYHRLEAAEIYVDMGRLADARAQLERIADLPPVTDVLDPHYQREAAALLARLGERAGG